MLLSDGWSSPITLSIKNNFVSAVPEPIHSGRPEDTVGESFRPFRDIQIRRNHRTFAFIAFGNHIMEVFAFILKDHGQKIHIGKLFFERLTVSVFDGIQNAG